MPKEVDQLQLKVSLLEGILQQCKAHIRNIMPERGPINRQHARMLDEIYAVEDQIDQIKV